ncbi:hypothetical protein BT69DRAFT_1289578, partial [Atractiella rhizophila]
MHAHGFAHLDLKRNNVVAIADDLKVVNFGFSCEGDDNTVLDGYRGTRSWWLLRWERKMD